MPIHPAKCPQTMEVDYKELRVQSRDWRTFPIQFFKALHPEQWQCQEGAGLGTGMREQWGVCCAQSWGNSRIWGSWGSVLLWVQMGTAGAALALSHLSCAVLGSPTPPVPRSVTSGSFRGWEEHFQEVTIPRECGPAGLCPGALLEQDGMSLNPFPAGQDTSKLCPGGNPTRRGCAEQGAAEQLCSITLSYPQNFQFLKLKIL